MCHIFKRVITLYNTLDVLEPDTVAGRRLIKKRAATTEVVQKFLNVIAQDTLLTKLFQYSCCVNEDAYDEQLTEVLEIQERNKEAAQTSASDRPQKPKPPHGKPF